jgi:hypothetical protein
MPVPGAQLPTFGQSAELAKEMPLKSERRMRKTGVLVEKSASRAAASRQQFAIPLKVMIWAIREPNDAAPDNPTVHQLIAFRQFRSDAWM